MAHLSEPPPSVQARRPELPEAVDRVLARALAKVPEKRYESCREFADALRGALGLAPGPTPSRPDRRRSPARTGYRRPAVNRSWQATQAAPPRRRAPAFSSPRPPAPAVPLQAARRRWSWSVMRLGAWGLGILVAVAVGLVIFRVARITVRSARPPATRSLPSPAAGPPGHPARQPPGVPGLERSSPCNKIVTTGSQERRRGPPAVLRVRRRRRHVVSGPDAAAGGGGRRPGPWPGGSPAARADGWPRAPGHLDQQGRLVVDAGGHARDRLRSYPGTTSRWSPRPRTVSWPQAGGNLRNQAVIWIWPDGTTWQRLTATQLGLNAAGTPRHIRVRHLAGNDTLISDGSGVWLSTDGGTSWTHVTVPAGHAASGGISGLASTVQA